MLQLDVQFLALVAGVVIPGLVGLLAKAKAKRWFKIGANAFLSFAAAAANLALQADGKVRIGDWLFEALITWGLAELAYQRLYKPTGTAAFIRERVPGGMGPVEDDEEYRQVVASVLEEGRAGLVLPGSVQDPDAQEETVRLTPIPPTAPDPVLADPPPAPSVRKPAKKASGAAKRAPRSKPPAP